MNGAIPFTLRIRRQKSVRGFGHVTRKFHVYGKIRFDGEFVHLEWTGTVQVETKEMFDADRETVTVPLETVEVPVSALDEAGLRGGWILPRIELRERTLAALADVPSERHGRLRLFIARSDRERAAALVREITTRLADPAFANSDPGSRSGLISGA
ncbi:MAG: hypothetical protein ACHQXA_02440 [Gemmatimonadales bacterium]